MNIKEAIGLMTDLMNMAIDDHQYIATRFTSGPGLGKSSAVDQAVRLVAARRAMRGTAKIVRLCEIEQPDLKGYGLPPEGNAANKPMQWSLPFWVWDTVKDGDFGVLFLDELSQASDDLQKVSAELLLHRRMGDYTLPDNVIVIAAGNRESDRSGVRRTLSFVQNRLMDINIEPNKDALVEYMERKNMSPHVISFLEAHPGDILRDCVPEKAGPFATPRTLEMVDALIGKMSMERFTECAAGLLGEGVGAKLVAHLRVIEQLPKYADIVRDPKHAALPERPDASYAVTHIIAHNVTPETSKPAFEYLRRMGQEFQAAALRTTIRRCPSIVQQKDFALWLKENRSLLEAANLLDRKPT